MLENIALYEILKDVVYGTGDVGGRQKEPAVKVLAEESHSSVSFNDTIICSCLGYA